MMRMKNLRNGVPHKNMFSEALNNENESEYYKLDEKIYGREIIEEKLRDINLNIEKIGKLCDRKKARSFEEYNCVLNFNKGKLNDELNNYKNKLIAILKNSTREEDIKRLQEDFMRKKINVFNSNKSLEKLNKTLYAHENKMNSLKQDSIFYDKEIKNSLEYNNYLKSKLKEIEDEQKFKQSSYLNINNSNPSSVSLGITNRQPSAIKKEKSFESKKNDGNDDADKLRKYFDKSEMMIKQKLEFENKKKKEKNVVYQSMMNFKNPIIEILRNKIKIYEDKQVDQMTEKVSNQEIFFNKSKDSKDATFIRDQISILKSKSLFTKLNNYDKKEIIKSFLEDVETKRIIYSYLYDN